jgi:hypothetical protein
MTSYLASQVNLMIKLHISSDKALKYLCKPKHLSFQAVGYVDH